MSLSILHRATSAGFHPHWMSVFVTQRPVLRTVQKIRLDLRAQPESAFRFYPLCSQQVSRTSFSLPIHRKYSYRGCRSRNAITHEAGYAFLDASHKDVDA
jgi:hypothetical protein